MTSWVDIVNFSVAIAGLTMSLIGLFIIVSVPISFIDKRTRYLFIAFFVLLSLYVASNVTSIISLYFFGSSFVFLSRTAVFLESFFSSLLIPLLIPFLLRCAGEDYKKSPWFAASLGLLLVYFVLLVVTQFSTAIYTFTEDNVYTRGPLYPILLIPPALSMLLNLILLACKSRKLSSRQRRAFLTFFIVPTICMLIQMSSYGLLLIVLGTSLAGLALFAFILTDLAEKANLQAVEIANQKASILVLQMRPHFIYNTLTSIYYLCEIDPGRAQQVILDFTNYLRRNFAAVSKEYTVPFTEELAHTRAYLSVEQSRYEDRLAIEYDIPHIHFHLPPLTLQPIVENAVKHGIRPKNILHIKIATGKEEDTSVITVEDSGPGFGQTDGAGAASEEQTTFGGQAAPQISALSIIGERLSLMCNGTLYIRPREGGGTVVEIKLP